MQWAYIKRLGGRWVNGSSPPIADPGRVCFPLSVHIMKSTPSGLHRERSRCHRRGWRFSYKVFFSVLGNGAFPSTH